MVNLQKNKTELSSWYLFSIYSMQGIQNRKVFNFLIVRKISKILQLGIDFKTYLFKLTLLFYE